MIFISYSWFDKKVADAVVERMRRARISYWIDSERLDLEKDLECQIVHGMKQSSHILLIESSSSMASPWVQFEVDIARELNRSIERLSLGKSPPFEAGPMMNCAQLRPLGFDATPLSAKITQAH
jgi:hypothetical protein